MWWRQIPRRRRVAIVSTAVVLLVVVGTLLARYLSTENVERDDTPGGVAGTGARRHHPRARAADRMSRAVLLALRP